MLLQREANKLMIVDELVYSVTKRPPETEEVNQLVYHQESILYPHSTSSPYMTSQAICD